ncbi:MAG: histidine kinase N-terminal 7TM domain-containing protein [Anaerolineales bacterium]
MSIQIIPISLIVLAAFYAGVGLFVWSRRPGLAVTPFAWMMFSVAVWSMGYGLELLSSSANGSIFWAAIKVFGSVGVPFFFLTFSTAYSGRNRLLTARNYLLLSIVPVVTIFVILTNRYHHWFLREISIGSVDGLTYLQANFGNWFWIQTAYAYTLIVVAIIFLVLEVIQAPKPYNFQAGMVLLGALFPWVSHFLYLSEVIPHVIDLTPYAFLPMVLLVGWGVLRYRLLDILPTAPAVILHELQDGVLVLDSRQRILYINHVAEQLLQVEAEAAIGQPMTAICTNCVDELEELIQQRVPFVERKFSIYGKEKIFEIRISTLSEREREIRSSNRHQMILFRDVDQRKQVEAQLKRREAIMETLYLASHQFLRTLTWETHIPAFLERLGKSTQADRTFLFENYTGPDKQEYASLCFEWVARHVSPQIDNPEHQHVPLSALGPASWIKSLQRGELVKAQIFEVPEPAKTQLAERGVKSIVIAPVFVEKRWWGSLGLEKHTELYKWSKAELEMLQAAAGILSAAELRSNNEHVLHRRQRTLNLLHQIVASALQNTDLHSMTQTVVEQLGQLFGSSGCFLALWNARSQQFIPYAAYGEHQEQFLSLSLKPQDLILAATFFERGNVLLVEDTATSAYLSAHIAKLLSFQSALILPLASGNKRLGVILLTFSQQRKFSNDEVSVGQQAAGLIALALEKIQAVGEARKQAEKAETIRQASSAISATLNSSEAVDRILEQLSRVIPFDSASVQLLRENEMEIVGGRGWDNPKEVLGIRFPYPADNPNTVVLQTGQPYLLGDARSAYAIFREAGPHSHIRSWLGIPLTIHGEVIGLLAIDSKELNFFTEEHLQTASTFASHVAIALNNAHLFEEVQNMALTDALTGLYNRRGLFGIGQIEFSRALRAQEDFSVIMLDLDHFKQINDTYGHPVGDKVLKELADIIAHSVRGTDIAGRYGGEEFVICLSGTGAKGAKELAERLRKEVKKKHFGFNGHNITISLGVASYNQNNPNLETLIARADQALYAAKHNGRNRVVIGE